MATTAAGDGRDDGSSDDAALGAACSRITEDVCRAGSPQRATLTPDPSYSLATTGTDIFYNGQETDFDAPSFRYATVEDCAPHGHVFAWDKNDVYRLSPQSCGGGNCGGNYTGYAWVSMGVRNPADFRWLAGGYATDGRFLYNQWHEGALAAETPSNFEVFLCGEYGTPFGFDGVNWFENGKRLSRDEARSKLRTQSSL